MMTSYLIQRLIYSTLLCVSIAISVGLEYFTNPEIHRYLNCPNIMRMKWRDYSFNHAALSGWKCAWWLIYPAFVILPINKVIVAHLSVFNVLLPIGIYLIEWLRGKRLNMFLGHNILYTVNTLVLAISCIVDLRTFSPHHI